MNKPTDQDELERRSEAIALAATFLNDCDAQDTMNVLFNALMYTMTALPHVEQRESCREQFLEIIASYDAKENTCPHCKVNAPGGTA